MADLFVAEQPGSAGAARVVLVHGSLDRSTAFLRVGRVLTDLTVVRYDRRGYARSLAVGAGVAFTDQVEDLDRVVAETPSVIAGHSLGGVVAMAFAERHPDLATAVVAYEAPMPWEPWWPSGTAGSVAMADPGDEAAAAERFMRRMVGDERWNSLPERTREQRRAEGPALVAELRSLRPPNPPAYDAASVGVPVIAAHGTASRPHHQRAARTLAERAPAGELVVIDGASHGAHLTHPKDFADLVRRALARSMGEREGGRSPAPLAPEGVAPPSPERQVGQRAAGRRRSSQAPRSLPKASDEDETST